MDIFKANKNIFKLGTKTYVMGILNITPDSFSDGGIWNSPELAVKRAIEIQSQGADIIDIGAQSTRPGHIKISEDEELKRLITILPKIRKFIDIPISIDTFYPSVANKALDIGVDIINDVTGFENKNMFEVVSHSDCGCIIMHDKENLDIKNFFNKKLNQALQYGISPNRICFDPGIGFGKNYNQNLFILNNISEFKIKNNALLIGASRKRVIGESCGNPPFDKRTPGTIAAHTIAILRGADIIRVHDVSEAVQAVNVTDKILNKNGDSD